MPRAFIFYLFLTVAGLPIPPEAFSQEGPRAHAAWWVEQHGAMTDKDDHRVAWVREVWRGVEAASERSPKRLPRLVLLLSHQVPLSLSLPDGSVLINQAAISLTYEGVGRLEGDARMAFLLGHELAHLAMDDFWQAEAFAGIQKVPELDLARQNLEQLLSETNTKNEGRVTRLRELQADAHGMITMSNAGYDPNLIVKEDSNFFRIWSSRVMERQKSAAASDKHPSDLERASLLKSQLRGVRGHLLVFDAGTKLLQLGRHEDARILLENFRNYFPGRSVFNNLGLCEFQLALRELAACDSRHLSQYMTSIITDVETVGALTRGSSSSRRDPGKNCLGIKTFQASFRRSLLYFEKSATMDPGYIPARINLSSARLLGGDPPGAMSAADQVLRRVPDHRMALNNKAAALHAFGLQMGMDTSDRALNILERILDKHPEFAPAAYNKAVLLSERKRSAAALEAWNGLLNQNLPQIYRKEVHNRLGLNLPGKPAPRREGITPPLPLGALTPSGRSQLESMACTRVRSGDFKARACISGDLQVIQIGRIVELVSLVPDLALENKLNSLDPPTYSLFSGEWETLFYPGLLVDQHTNGTKRFWWFLPTLRGD